MDAVAAGARVEEGSKRRRLDEDGAERTAQPSALIDPSVALLPEIWSEVVNILVAHDPDAPIGLSHVSRSWRRTILRQTTAWRMLLIAVRDRRFWGKTAITKATTWMLRSKGRLIHVVIATENLRGSFADGNLPQMLARILKPAIPHVQQLWLTGMYVADLTAEWQQQCYSLRDLRLERFGVDYDSAPLPTKLCDGLINPAAVSLRTFESHGPAEQILDILPAQARDIVIFEAGCDTNTEISPLEPHQKAQSLSLHRRLLGWMPDLHILRLRERPIAFVGTTYETVEEPTDTAHLKEPRVILPQLRTIEGYEVLDDYSWLHHVSAPALRTVGFDLSTASLPASAVAFMQDLAPVGTITSLCINTRGEIPPAPLRSILVANPRIRRLRLNESCGLASNLFAIMCADPGLVPQLDSISVGLNWETEGADLLRLTEFRNDPDIQHAFPAGLAVKLLKQEHGGLRLLGTDRARSLAPRTGRQRQDNLGLRLEEIEYLRIYQAPGQALLVEEAYLWLKEHLWRMDLGELRYVPKIRFAPRDVDEPLCACGTGPAWCLPIR